MGEPAFGVKMPADINERDEAGIALERVEPIFYPRIRRDVGIPAKPDINAVSAVIQHGKENKCPFHERTKWNGLQFAGNGVVFFGRNENSAVGPEMLGKKCPDWNNPRQRMQLSEQITRIRLGCRGRHALSAAWVPELCVELYRTGALKIAAISSIGSSMKRRKRTIGSKSTRKLKKCCGEQKMGRKFR